MSMPLLLGGALRLIKHKELFLWWLDVLDHLFILDISIAPLQVHYYSEALPTQHGYRVGILHRHRQLQVKDFPKVPTCQLERDSNPRPSG